MNNNNGLSIGLSILSLGLSIVVGCIALFGASHATKQYGGTSNYDTLSMTGFVVGANCNTSFDSNFCTGTQASSINFGSCYVIANTAAETIAASSSETVDCAGYAAGASSALPGITYGADLDLQLSTSSPSTYQGLQILGASASTTPGYITARIFNATGASFTWTTQASSSITYQSFHI